MLLLISPNHISSLSTTTKNIPLSFPEVESTGSVSRFLCFFSVRLFSIQNNKITPAIRMLLGVLEYHGVISRAMKLPSYREKVCAVDSELV